MSKTLRSLIRDERAQDLIEYSLLILFVALAAFVALELLGITTGAWWIDIQTRLAAFLTGA